MNLKRINPHWKRAFLMILCFVQIMVLVYPAASVFAADRDYLIGSLPAQEGANIGATSSLIKISEDPAWAGITSKATMTAAEAIAPVGEQRATVINSPIAEGFANPAGATYPLLAVDCAWQKLDAATQDLMYYIELPAQSSELRVWSLTCNSWGFWVSTDGMEYQYLSVDSDTWVNGKVSTDGNKTLKLTPGFKGYVRYKLDTASNVATLADKNLTVQDFTFRADLFGGSYGALKIGGVWFVSKENYTKIKVGDGEVEDMLPAPATDGRDYLLATMPGYEGANPGDPSSAMSIDSDPAWGGIASQVTLKGAAPITIIGEQNATAVDSPISEGFRHSAPTYPILSLGCAWKQLDTKNQDLMIYVELPAASSKLRLNSLTCNSWSFWVSPDGMQYQYLSMDDNQWVNGTVSADKDVVLPTGFKGYVRLKINTAGNASSFPDAVLTVQNLTFQADCFGGEYGPLLIGGVWFVSKEDYAKIQIGEGEVLNMTNVPPEDPEESEPTEPSQPDEPTEPSEPGQWTGDVIIGHYQNNETGSVGGTASQVSIQKDQNWWGNPSKAIVQLTAGVTPIGDTYGYLIDSPIGEGYANPTGQTAPFFNLFGSWSQINALTQDFMFYIELPAVSQGLRMHGFTCTSGEYCWPDPAGMKYQYLAMDGEQWVDGTVSTDGNKTLALPKGFKGYVRFELDTAPNFNKLPGTTLSVERMQFYIDRFGGDNGPVKIGGVWVVSRENTNYIQLDDGEVMCMTNPGEEEPEEPTEPTEPTEPSEPTEPTEPIDPEDPDRDYLIGHVPPAEESPVGADSAIVFVSEDPAWAGITSKATVKTGEGINIISDQKAAVIDSPMTEGYSCTTGATYPLLQVDCAWTELDTKTQDLMFYLELPNASKGIRFWAITCNGWTFWVAPEGMEYQYLSMDSDKWVNGKISTDGNKTLALPQGFKGYVRLKVNTASNAGQFPDSTLKVQCFNFRLDLFGGDYGPAKLGGVWFVTKENYCHIRVDGGEKKVMTNYWKDNDAAISQFNELLAQLENKDLSAAPVIDKLQSLYDSMSDEYKAKISAEDLEKITEYAAAVDSYRPSFLGVSLKAAGSENQALKIGWKSDEALANECGYQVVGCGAVMMYSRKYDGSSIIDESLTDVTVLEGQLVDGACVATAEIPRDNYLEDVLVRCYVVYENTETGDQFSIWCGSYTNQAGQAKPYLQCSLFEVANYFGVPLYAK